MKPKIYKACLTICTIFLSAIFLSSCGKNISQEETTEAATELVTLSCPTGLACTSAKQHSLSFSWSEVENADKYTITITKSNIANATSLTVTDTTATFTGLPIEQSYLVDIVAECDSHKPYKHSEKSTQITVNTTAPDIPTIANISASANSDSEISISWDAYDSSLKNADGTDAAFSYILQSSSSSEGEYTDLSTDLTDASYTNSDLSEQTTVYYKVILSVTMDGKNYKGTPSEIANATTQSTPVVQPSTNSGYIESSGGSTSYGSSGLTSEQYAQAQAIAQQIANSIPAGTDLQRVSAAATAVLGYYSSGTHKESGPYYSTAYGVFIAKESSCAGVTRALGMVLDCMGISWTHANENQWTHQWCIVTMDGQTGWADGQLGWAGYGVHPIAQ